MEEIDVTIAVVGDTYTGKTNLIFSYANNEFIEEYSATVSDEYSVKDVTIKGSANRSGGSQD